MGVEGERRLLLISYHFPPASTAGALRWQKLAGHAADRGYALDVVTVAPESLTVRDDSRLKDIPPGTRIRTAPDDPTWTERLESRAFQVLRPSTSQNPDAGVGNGAAPPASARQESFGPEEIRWEPSLRSILRAWWVWQDWSRERSWGREAARVALAWIREEPGRHVAIVSCGPPHGQFVDAARVARKASLPLVVDLRDPWSHPRRMHESLASPFYYSLAQRAERRVVSQASLIVANTPALGDAFRETYPEKSDHIVTVMNGWDSDGVRPPRDESRRFRVLHAGALYFRDPRTFFQAARKIITAMDLTPGEFAIEFLGSEGNHGGVSIEAIAESEGIGPWVHVLPRMPRTDALEYMAGAAVLFALHQDYAFGIPSKIFEYLQFETWLLAIATPESPVAEVLRGTGADVVAPDDVEGIARVLGTRVRQVRQGILPGPISGRDRLSRGEQARTLFDALDALLEACPR